jgi:hypothetical protein
MSFSEGFANYLQCKLKDERLCFTVSQVANRKKKLGEEKEKANLRQFKLFF